MPIICKCTWSSCDVAAWLQRTVSRASVPKDLASSTFWVCLHELMLRDVTLAKVNNAEVNITVLAPNTFLDASGDPWELNSIFVSELCTVLLLLLWFFPFVFTILLCGSRKQLLRQDGAPEMTNSIKYSITWLISDGF